jgi:hypothetical protein
MGNPVCENCGAPFDTPYRGICGQRNRGAMTSFCQTTRPPVPLCLLVAAA